MELTLPQLFEIFPASYGARRFIVVFTSPCPEPDQPTPRPPNRFQHLIANHREFLLTEQTHVSMKSRQFTRRIIWKDINKARTVPYPVPSVLHAAIFVTFAVLYLQHFEQPP